MKCLGRTMLAVCLVILLALPAAAENSEQTRSVTMEPFSDLTFSTSLGEMICISQRIFVPAEGIMSVQINLDCGLVFISKARVLRDGTELSASLYTVTCRQSGTEEQMEVHFSERAVEIIREDGGASVEYAVRLNEDASVGGEGNRVRAYLLSGQMALPLGSLSVCTFTLNVYRGFQSADGAVRPVDGSCFSLYRGGETEKLIFAKSGTYCFRLCSLEDCHHKRHLTALRTEVNGVLILEGLAPGEYILKEERPAKGVSPYPRDLVLTIKEDGSVLYENVESPDGTVSLVTSGTYTSSADVTDYRFYRRGIPVMIALNLAALLTHRRRIKAIG